MSVLHYCLTGTTGIFQLADVSSVVHVRTGCRGYELFDRVFDTQTATHSFWAPISLSLRVLYPRSCGLSSSTDSTGTAANDFDCPTSPRVRFQELAQDQVIAHSLWLDRVCETTNLSIYVTPNILSWSSTGH